MCLFACVAMFPTDSIQKNNNILHPLQIAFVTMKNDLLHHVSKTRAVSPHIVAEVLLLAFWQLHLMLNLMHLMSLSFADISTSNSTLHHVAVLFLLVFSLFSSLDANDDDDIMEVVALLLGT